MWPLLENIGADIHVFSRPGGPSSAAKRLAGTPGGPSNEEGHWNMRILPTMTTVLAGTLAAAGPPAQAQDIARLAGAYLGRTHSEQLWSPRVATSRRPGFAVGAFVDVLTAVPFLRLRAEGGLVQRGGFVSTDPLGNPVDGQVRGDYLGFHLGAKATLSLGPVHAFALAGPGLDYLVRSREDPLLAQVLGERRETVLNALAGAGAGIRIGRTWVAEVEGRWVRGLTDAYSGSGLQVRNRSLEWIVRVSRAVAAAR